MKKNSTGKIFIGVLIMLPITAYFLTGVLRSLEGKVGLNASMMDIIGTYEFFMSTKVQNQALITVLTLVFIGYMVTKMKGISGYKIDDGHGVHGTSRWGKVEELLEKKAISHKNKFYKKPIKTVLGIEEGIILGKVPKKSELVILPNNTIVDNKNVFLIGASGSGKGQAFVYNNIINNKTKSQIITDPKGELYHATHQLKRDEGFKVYQIDFMNLNQARYNPLTYVYKDKDAKKVAESVAKNSSKDGKEDFFFSTARDLLTGLIIYCKSVNPKANIPIDVKGEFYKISEDPNYLLELCEDIGREHPAYAYLKDASVADGKTRSSILSSFAQQTAIFSLKDVERMTMCSDFDFHEFQEEKSILYVKIPMKDNPVEALTATFFDQLISVFYDIADEFYGVLPKPSQFLLDEFANLGKINGYENVLSTCRGLGIEMITIVQDIAQLENKYGKEITRSIVNNHDTKLFLRTGDVETAKYFSGLAGDTTAKMKTGSTSQSGGIFTGGSASKSSQEQYVKRPLITEGELLRIDRDMCYVFVSGFYPLKLEKAWQYIVFNDFLFNKNRKPNYENYQDKYLIKINDMNKKRNKVDLCEKKEDNNKEKVFINTGTNGELKKKDEEDVIVTKTVEVNKEPLVKVELEDDKENRTIDDSFNLLAQEFLMKGTKMNEVEEFTSLENSNTNEILPENYFGLEEVISEEDILSQIVNEYKELNEDIEALKEVELENDVLVKVMENSEEYSERFLPFVDDLIAYSEKDEEEFILRG